MKKFESILIYILCAILCPLLLFVFFWWVSALFVIVDVLPIPEVVIIISAFTGLALGVLLDILYLKKWHSRFYAEDVLILILLYFACSIVALAVFMGLPIGNLILGAVAGLYMGRRWVHTKEDAAAVPAKLKRVSLFTALVTGLEAVPIGLLALNEEWVVESFTLVLRMNKQAVQGFWGLVVIVFLTLVLMMIQFFITYVVGRMAYGKLHPT